MTAQISDKLLINKHTLSMTSEPNFNYDEKLKNYYKNLCYDKILTKEQFFKNTCEPLSSLYRGWVYTWEIKNNRLFYGKQIYPDGYETSTTLLYKGADPCSNIYIDIAFFRFHYAYSTLEQLRAWLGRELKYVNQGFLSIYENDIFFNVFNGIIKSFWITHNSLNRHCYPYHHHSTFDFEFDELKTIKFSTGVYYCSKCYHLATTFDYLPYESIYETEIGSKRFFKCRHEWEAINFDEYIIQCNSCGKLKLNKKDNFTCKCIDDMSEHEYMDYQKVKKIYNPNLINNLRVKTNNPKMFNIIDYYKI